MRRQNYSCSVCFDLFAFQRQQRTLISSSFKHWICSSCSWRESFCWASLVCISLINPEPNPTWACTRSMPDKKKKPKLEADSRGVLRPTCSFPQPGRCHSCPYWPAGRVSVAQSLRCIPSGEPSWSTSGWPQACSWCSWLDGHSLEH